MASSHFADDETLNEFLASPRRDRNQLNHVRCCIFCQRRTRARRLTRLQRFGTNADSGSMHATAQMLLAFSTERLNDGQMVQVMDHLSGCRDCRDAFAKLHAQLNGKEFGPL